MLRAAASDLCPYEQLSDPGAGLAAVLIAAAASGFAAADFGTVPLPPTYFSAHCPNNITRFL